MTLDLVHFQSKNILLLQFVSLIFYSYSELGIKDIQNLLSPLIAKENINLQTAIGSFANSIQELFDQIPINIGKLPDWQILNDYHPPKYQGGKNISDVLADQKNASKARKQYFTICSWFHS
jgi:hypothetical protein